MSSNKFSCLILKLPSLTSSSDPANIPAVPVFLYLVTLLKFLGIKSYNFFQSVNFPKKSLIVLIPSSVVKTGSFGIFIF